MMVSEWLRSCWGPSQLAHHGDIWSSLGNKHQKLHRPPFKWTTRSLLWYPFRFVEWKAKSVTTAEFTGDLTLKKTCVLLWATVRLDFTEYFNFRFSIKTKNNFKHKSWIWPAELFQFVSYCRTLMVWHWYLAMILFNKSDNKNHSNKDSDCLILVCFMRI